MEESTLKWRTVLVGDFELSASSLSVVVKFEGWGRKEEHVKTKGGKFRWIVWRGIHPAWRGWRVSGRQINKRSERISLERAQGLGEAQGLLKDATQGNLQGSKCMKTYLAPEISNLEMVGSWESTQGKYCMCLPCAHIFPQAFCFCPLLETGTRWTFGLAQWGCCYILALSCCERVGVLVVSLAFLSTSCRTNRAYHGATAESGTDGILLTFLIALCTTCWTYCEGKTLCFPKSAGLFIKMTLT